MIKNIVKSFKTSKKGNFAVLLSMIFVSLAIMVFVFIKASTYLTTISYASNILELSGRSILSEFHIGLKDSYGIIAFEGFEKETKDDLNYYIYNSFSKKNTSGRNRMIRLYLQDLDVSFAEQGLIDMDNFEKEVGEAYQYFLLKDWEGQGKDSFSQGKLINERIKGELPSYYLSAKGYNLNNPFNVDASKWSEAASNLSAEAMVNEYIMRFCNCNRENRSRIKTFMQNEIEYILYGKFDEVDNYNAFINQFRTTRFLLNSAHIYADAEKRNAVLATAEGLTPGPQAIATAALISEIWAGLETSNDRKLLLDGKGVALIKTDEDWAVTLQTAVDDFLNGTDSGNRTSYIEPEKESKMDYKMYLRLFLYCADRETKLARLMDIIQLNVQGVYDENFRIKDYYLGFNYKAKVNGKIYEYTQTY